MISLSAASRLNPSSTPTRTDMGMVTLKRMGRVKRKISAALEKVALLRTTISSMLGR